jgi:hypothetical protein
MTTLLTDFSGYLIFVVASVDVGLYGLLNGLILNPFFAST